MALSLGAALLGSAIIGGGAAAISSSSTNNAINRSTQAQTDAANQSIALQRDIYNQNKNALAPYTDRGNVAGSAINALLGLGGDTASAQSAFDNYLGSAGYQYQLNEANKAANAQFAAAGALDSGAAVKAAQSRATSLAGGYFGNYLGLLGNQQNVGLGAGSALAGVGQNFANNSTSINTNLANSISSANIAKANNTNDLLGNLSSSFGLGLGALSKFGGGFNPYSSGFEFGPNG